jgi:hypothetical protein
MEALLIKLLISFGFQLLRKHIADSSDTSELEERLISAKTKKEVLVIAKTEAIEAIDEHILTEVDVPDEVVDGLARADNTEKVVKVLESATVEQILLDAISGIVSGIRGLLSGLFRK